MVKALQYILCAAAVISTAALTSPPNPELKDGWGNKLKHAATTAVTTNEFLVVNGIVASPFAVTHGLVNAYYNLHRTVAASFPSVLKSTFLLAANALLGGAFLTSGK